LSANEWMAGGRRFGWVHSERALISDIPCTIARLLDIQVAAHDKGGIL
jgi:hypothetical protein